MTDSRSKTVVSMEDFRARRSAEEVEWVVKQLDEATSAAHYASTGALALIRMARQQLDLSDLPMP